MTRLGETATSKLSLPHFALPLSLSSPLFCRLLGQGGGGGAEWVREVGGCLGAGGGAECVYDH